MFSLLKREVLSIVFSIGQKVFSVLTKIRGASLEMALSGGLLVVCNGFVDGTKFYDNQQGRGLRRQGFR